MTTDTRLDTYRMVLRAILRRQQVIATYRGRRRKMCPHVLGLKSDRPQALFYQFGGESSAGLGREGSSSNWRCMFLDELEDVEVRPGRWHTASNYSRTQVCVGEMDVAVARVRQSVAGQVSAAASARRDLRKGSAKPQAVKTRRRALPSGRRVSKLREQG